MTTTLPPPNHLPEDILVEILSRLPVKSLLKFRFVSKSWQSLISTRNFAKSHLRFSTPKRLFCLVQGGTSPSLSHCNYGERQLQILGTTNSGNIIGSSNGLVCAFSNGVIKFWNPATRKFKTTHLPDVDARYTYGFGYDAANDDYKVFALQFKTQIVHVNVYSLSANAWRCMDSWDLGAPCGCNELGVFANGANAWRCMDSWDLGAPCRCNELGVFANGVIYWHVNCCKSEVNILAVNVTTETYKVIAYPDTVFGQKLVCASQSHLYLLAGIFFNNECDLHMLKGDGTVKDETWTEPAGFTLNMDPIDAVEASPEMWKFDEEFKFHEVASAVEYVNFRCILYRESLVYPDSFE